MLSDLKNLPTQRNQIIVDFTTLSELQITHEDYKKMSKEEQQEILDELTTEFDKQPQLQVLKSKADLVRLFFEFD